MNYITYVHEIFSKERNLNVAPLTKIELDEILDVGISSLLIRDFYSYFPYLILELPTLLKFSQRKINKYHRHNVLRSQVSKRLILLIALCKKGEMNLRQDNFIYWLSQPSHELQGMRPLDHIAGNLKDIKRVDRQLTYVNRENFYL